MVRDSEFTAKAVHCREEWSKRQEGNGCGDTVQLSIRGILRGVYAMWGAGQVAFVGNNQGKLCCETH